MKKKATHVWEAERSVAWLPCGYCVLWNVQLYHKKLFFYSVTSITRYNQGLLGVAEP